MAEELVMPRLSDTMERGTVSRWMKHEGDAVAEGDVLAEIETDKAIMELTSYHDGVLLRILVQDGESADLGAPIAIVGAEGEEAPEAPPASESTDGPAAEASEEPAEAPEETAEVPASERSEVPGSVKPAPPAPESGDGAKTDELRASPVARRMAAEAGVDLRPLAGRGSGPDGRIVRVDVERLVQGDGAAPQEAPAPPQTPAPAGASERFPDGEVIKPSAMLRAVARRMAEAKATVPHFYLETAVDMTRSLQVRADLNDALADTGEKISVNDLVVRASALALRENPQFHRSWVDGTIVAHPRADIGIAVALDEGLIVPIVRDAGAKGVREIARETRELAGRAREGGLRQHEIEGATFTVSNLGMFGIERFAAIINPPEPGILAVGATVERPVAIEGRVEVRPMMAVVLSVDHRAASGADGARFLQTLRKLLESGVLLLA